MKSKLKESADFAYDRLKDIKGVTPIKATAAMYMMVKINIDEFEDITGDVDFAKKLLNE
jgi:tyrosine aminotransferase